MELQLRYETGAFTDRVICREHGLWFPAGDGKSGAASIYLQRHHWATLEEARAGIAAAAAQEPLEGWADAVPSRAAVINRDY